MNRLLLPLCVALALLPTAHAQRSRPPDRVGDRGDPRRLTFAGLESFKPEALQEALARDLTYQFAIHPLAPAAPLPAVLQQRLALGLRHAGFPEVRAIARFEGQGLHVTIAEGPRLRAGELHLTGLTQVDAEAFRAALLRPRPKQRLVPVFGEEAEESPPVWEPGEPVAFDEATAEARERRLQTVCRDFGLWFAETELRLEQRPDAGLADLHLTFTRQGPRGRVGTVTVTGLEQNRQTDFLAALALEPGQVLDQALVNRVQRALWATGRFRTWSVEPRPPQGDEAPGLAITVEEFPGLPALHEKLTREQQTLLRAAQWLSELSRRRRDLRITGAVTIPPAEGQDEAGPPHRLTVSLAAGHDGSGSLATDLHRGDEPVLSLVASLCRGELLVADRLRDTVARGPAGRYGVELHCRLEPDPNPQEGSLSRLQISGGLRTVGDEPAGGRVRLFTHFAPAVLLSLSLAEEANLKWRGDTLVVTRQTGAIIEIAETGEVLRVEISGEREGDGLRIDFGATADSTIAERHAELAAPEPAESPLGACLNLVSEAVLRAAEIPTEDRELLLKLLGQVLRPETLAPFAEAFPAAGDDAFSIPVGEGQRQIETVAGAAWYVAAWLLPRESWAWTLSREACFVAARRPNYTADTLKLYYGDRRHGPLAMGSAAILLSRVNPGMARLFADRALDLSITSANADRDIQPFLRGDGVLSRALLAAIKSLRTVPADDYAALGERLGPKPAALCGVLRQHAADPEITDAELLRRLYRQLWDAHLQAKLHQRLTSIAYPTPQGP